MSYFNKIQILFMLSFLIMLPGRLKSQTEIPVFGKQKFFNGYSKEIKGESLSYFSVYQDVAKEALLTRCTNGKKVIEWITDTIPAAFEGKYVYFSWIAAHSSGTSKGIRNFDLFVNDSKKLTFSTSAQSYPPLWSFSGTDSSRLVFEFKVLDRALDSHGFCFLRVPFQPEMKGKPLKIKVVGQNQGSNDWYMTFKYAFKENIDAFSTPFLLKSGEGNKQPIVFNVVHFGPDAVCTITMDASNALSFPVKSGFNSFEVPVNAVRKKSILHIRAEIKGFITKEFDFELSPVVYREVNLVHHAHTDIGYSDYQENVVKIHTNNIYQAMKLIEATRDYPVESRFKWNIEAMWDVENFMEVASAKDKTRFIGYVKSGDIALNGFYINALTGLCSPAELDWLLEYGKKFNAANGTAIKSVMFCDIPGLNWGVVDALAKQHIRYFLNGPNYSGGGPDMGDRIGSTIRKFGDKPFWWVSHTGKDSILFWTGYKGYSSFHQLSVGAIHQRGEKLIAENLQRLDSTHYPYEMVIWNYNIVSDNGPTDSTISVFVKNWNEKYSSPKLGLTTAGEALSRFEKKYGSSIPSLKGDFSPYWEDGAYSTAAEECRNRELSNQLTQFENYALQTGKRIDANTLYRAHRSIIMFHEHTWGAWSSISDPEGEFSIRQWNYKKRFLDSAQIYIDRIDNALFAENRKSPSRSFEIINTNSNTSSSYVDVNVPAGLNYNTLLDQQGQHIEFQKLKNGKIMFLGRGIPRESFEKYSLITEKEGPNFPKHNFKTELKTDGSKLPSDLEIKIHGNWVNFRKLFKTIYAQNVDPTIYFSDSVISIQTVESGPLLKKYKITESIKGCKDLFVEVSDYADSDELKIEVSFTKEKISEKEAMHFKMDFGIGKPEIRYGINDTCVNPRDGLLPASNFDFFSVQRWMDVSDDSAGVTISCPQMALFEVGDLVNENKAEFGRRVWKEVFTPSSKIYIYALNNYWHTNYKASQEGTIRFDVWCKFHGKFSLEESNRFGLEKQQPLLVKYFPE